ncbi:MAG TPA: hypothetical protein VFE60_16140 [Roseiarcus sp.]|nr:hypothetical protein [Roseiarcus sp.]
MTINLSGALSRWFTGSVLGGLIAFAFVPTATAQWLTPWGAASPGEIERSLEAQGYGLIAPLVRRPGVYLADVSAGRDQRLVIDARSGQILERFISSGRAWGPALAARGEEFGGPPPPGGAGPPLSPGFSGPHTGGPGAKSAYGGPANVHIPAAISPYGAAEAPAGTKSRPKSVSTERKTPATKPVSTPPLPPPAPRELATPDGSDSLASKPTENHDSDQPKIDSRPTEVDNVPPAVAPPHSSAEASDKPKVSIVPPALFE